LDVAGGVAGMLTGGGGAGAGRGILQKAGQFLRGGGQGAGGGMLKNIAGNVLGGQNPQGAGVLQGLAGKVLGGQGGVQTPPGGGILQNIAGKVLGSQNPQGGGLLQNIAGNVLGGQGSGQGAGILQGLAGKFLGEEGMRVPYDMGGEVRRPMLVIKMDEGGVTGDPIPNGTGNGNGNGNGDTEYGGYEAGDQPTDIGGLPSREYQTVTYDVNFPEKSEIPGFQEGSEKYLGAINKNFDLSSQSFNDLDDEMKQNLRNSRFGQRYFSEDGDMDAEYNVYLGEVDEFFANTPKEVILGRIDEMAAASPNFAKGIKDAKTNEEKLAAAKRLMTDGKIGEYHGALLGEEKLKKSMTTFNPSNVLPSKYSGGTAGEGSVYDRNYIISVGNRQIHPNSIQTYLDDALEAGVDITNPSHKTGAWIESWMDENEDAIQKPGHHEQGGYDIPFAEQYEKDHKLQHTQGDQSRKEQQKLRQNVSMAETNIQKARQRQSTTEEEMNRLLAELEKAQQAAEDFKLHQGTDRYDFSQFSQAFGGSVNPFKVLKR
jgi:hypothetical protein